MNNVVEFPRLSSPKGAHDSVSFWEDEVKVGILYFHDKKLGFVGDIDFCAKALSDDISGDAREFFAKFASEFILSTVEQ